MQLTCANPKLYYRSRLAEAKRSAPGIGSEKLAARPRWHKLSKSTALEKSTVRVRAYSVRNCLSKTRELLPSVLRFVLRWIRWLVSACFNPRPVSPRGFLFARALPHARFAFVRMSRHSLAAAM